MDISSVNILWCMDLLHKKGHGAARHNHEFYHYVYVREGVGHAVVNGQSVALVPHSVCVFNPLTFHEFTAEESMRLYEVKFEVKDAELSLALANLSTLIPADPTEIERIFSVLLTESDQDSTFSSAYRRTLLLEFLLTLLLQNQRKTEEGGDPYGLLEVVRYMRTHYGEELKNEDLAAILHMEKSYFIKRFKERFGVPPRQYLMSLRMERAAALIESSDTKVSKIAELCGFKSIHHFSNAYKRHYGISPAKHREKHTNR